MKRTVSLVLAIMILCSLATPAFASQLSDGSDVVAKYVTTYAGEYRADIVDGEATAGGITVTGAPANAVMLVVIPMEGDALSWVDGCVDGSALAAYDIHFLDAEGNRINANGAKVSVTASGSNLTVSSVTTSGTDRKLTSEVSSGKASFTTDGSHYYVIAQKTGGGEEPSPGPGDTVTVPVRGDENTVHADVTITEEDTVKLHELDFEEIDHVVGDHVDTGVVEIDLTGLDEDVTKVVLPVTTMEHIVEAAEEAHNDTEALQIDFPSGSVKLDDKTMRAIVEQAEGNEVMLVLENVGETRLNDTQDAVIADWNVYGGYEAYLLCVESNKRISDFEGGVATLSGPFTVPTGLNANKFSVWYVADDGKTEKLDTRYANEHLVWDVGHFSDFIIVYEGNLSHEHSFTNKASNVKATDANCTEAATYYVQCDNCSEHTTEKTVPVGDPLGHDWDEGTVTTKPTCEQDGVRTFTCKRDNTHTDTKAEPATGHSFTKYESDNNATCKKDGTETAKCDHGCGKTDTRTDKGSRLGHKYEDGKCIRCGLSWWNPETGDTIMIAVVALIASSAALIMMVVWKKKNKK